MALFRQKESKYWWISIYRGRGVPRLQVSTRTTNREVAAAMEANLRLAHRGNLPREKIMAALDTLMGAGAARQSIPLADVWAACMALPEAADMAPRRIEARKGAWRRFVAFCSQHRPACRDLHQVDRPTCQAWQEHMTAEGLSGKSVKNYRVDMAATLALMFPRYGIEGKPWTGVRAPPANSTHGRAFTREEEVRILAACHDEWRGMCIVARWTGLRRGDCARLRWSAIHDGWIRLTPSKTERHGTKVSIPIHPTLAAFLATLPRDEDFVFPRFGHRPTSTMINAEFSKILAAAGVTDTAAGRVTFHSWRHTFRTRLAEAGATAESAKKLGGWTSDIDEIYNHDETALQRAILAMK
jgi:integrase